MQKHLTVLLISVALNLAVKVCPAQYDGQSSRYQSGFSWPEDKKMALSLTFADARVSQVIYGIPLLDRYGVKATFYVTPHGVLRQLDSWKEAVKNGHELGNHTVRHPCNVNYTPQKGLADFTLDRMKEELDSCNRFIEETFGFRPVSYAYTCGETHVGRGTETKSYVPLVASLFETGRGSLHEGPNDPRVCDMAQLTGMELDGLLFEEVLKLIKAAKSKGQWLIFGGHEMNEGKHLQRHVSLLSTLDSICRYATDPANGIWIDNVRNIASYVKEKRGEEPFSE